jgi:hypothetical protein
MIRIDITQRDNTNARKFTEIINMSRAFATGADDTDSDVTIGPDNPLAGGTKRKGGAKSRRLSDKMSSCNVIPHGETLGLKSNLKLN